MLEYRHRDPKVIGRVRTSVILRPLAVVPDVDKESSMVTNESRAPIREPEKIIRNSSAQRRTAVILAAGQGSRLLRGINDPPKPLTELLGLTLVERAIRSCRVAGVDDFVVAVGYRGEELAPYLRTLGLDLGVNLRVAESRNWQLGNGASALACEPYVKDTFFVIMSDHVFAPQFLDNLIDSYDERYSCSVVVDLDLENVRDLHEATKVQIEGAAITEIGKELTNFDAVDTGVFLSNPALFDALREAAVQEKHAFGDAIQLLASQGEVSWAPTAGMYWQDIDTPEDLAFARSNMLARGLVRTP